MPTYEYACTSCGEHLEVVQSMKDGPLTECAECGGRLRKVFSPIGIVFKGSGFYKTDSRSSNGRKPTKDTPAKDTAAKDSGGDSASPAKPAAGSGSSASSDKGSSGTSGTSAGGSAKSA